MSGYRNLVSWNTSSDSGSYTGAIKKETMGLGIPKKYDATYSRSKTDVGKNDKGLSSSRISTKYTSAYDTGCQRDTSAQKEKAYATRTENLKLKLDKKNTTHPPITYIPLIRTGASREPSPVDRSEKSSSSSSSYNYNRLYPKSYNQRSVSSDRTESTNSSSTIPKYMGRTSIGRNESPKLCNYLLSKDDASSKYSGRSSISSNDSVSARYKVAISNKNSSREDLSGSQKYIKSRFLPKNSIEKSYTAFSRPSKLTKTKETSRKNKEIFNVLHVQQKQELQNRSISRCSSVTTIHNIVKNPIDENTTLQPMHATNNVEMLTVNVVDRATSPNLTYPNKTFSKSTQFNIAKTIRRQITKPKNKIQSTADKKIQSDRMDDSTKTCRFTRASKITATPWSSFLDLKFSSPNSKQDISNRSGNFSNNKEKLKECNCQSPKSLSRSSSTKSLVLPLSGLSVDVQPNKSLSFTSQAISTKQAADKKQLPPQIPKIENLNKQSFLHSVQNTNKDFRKSVLNMGSGKSKQKIGRRSNSVSSADSDIADPDPTDVSENFPNYKSNQSQLKLPKKKSVSKAIKMYNRSPSFEPLTNSSNTNSSGEDDIRNRQENKISSAVSSRTSVILSSADDISIDNSSKLSSNPKQKMETKTENEAKSFLMRALGPVTNLFKVQKQQETLSIAESSEPYNNTSKPTRDLKKHKRYDNNAAPLQAKLIIHKMETLETPWRIIEKKQENCNSVLEHTADIFSQAQLNKKSVDQYVSSEKLPWWKNEITSVPIKVNNSEDNIIESNNINVYSEQRNEKSDINQIVTNTDESSFNSKDEYFVNDRILYDEDKKDNKESLIYKKRDDTTEVGWWEGSSDKSNSDVKRQPLEYQDALQTQSQNDSLKPNTHFERNDSLEKNWWKNSDDKSNSDIVYSLGNEDNNINIDLPDHEQQMYKVRRNDSSETNWWLSNSDKSNVDDKNKNQENQEYDLQSDEKYPFYVRRNDSAETSWWQSSSDKTNSDAKANVKDPEFHKIRHIDSDEKFWWISSSENIPDINQTSEVKPQYAICHQDSGEKPWWLEDNEVKNDEPKKELDNNCIPLGDRSSPEGIEMPKNNKERPDSPYDNIPSEQNKSETQLPIFISKHKNIDDILGGSTQIWSPIMNKIFSYESKKEKPESAEITKINGQHSRRAFPVNLKLDDAALQLYKDGDYGSYLDLEASISEQQEEFEGFQSNKKNSIVLRTQLSVRVHTIIEQLLTSEGRELRRALFSLKQIFQEDKDLVHEFVQNDGLSCLIKVGSEADQNYQNYILRALGQVMLYVDGMNGVMEHNQTIQWLYSLISSKFRLVVKTALKLLLVFVEYTDSNCLLLIKAIHTVDYSQAVLPYYNIMKLLKDFDSADTELLIYATTLINKVLNGVPDQDLYYDQTDALEEQGFEGVIQRYISKPGTDLDLLQQFQIYEAVLQFEDEEEIGGMPIKHLDENVRNALRNRKSLSDSTERRKSRRHSTGNALNYQVLNRCKKNKLQINKEDEDNQSSSSQSSELSNSHLNGSYKDSNKANDVGVTPALKRRRERAERQRSLMKEQETAGLFKRFNNIEGNNINITNENGNYTIALQQMIANGNGLSRNPSRQNLTPLMNAVNKMDMEENMNKPWIYSVIQNQEEQIENTNDNERNRLLQLKKENTVKDLTQKLANQNILNSSFDENKVNRIGDMSGLISKAKEGLAKSKSKADILKSSTSENIIKMEVKKTENELKWEELVAYLNRSLNLCDMDFTDLTSGDEVDILAPTAIANGIPPPPPPLRDLGSAPPPPPPSNRMAPPAPNPPLFGANLQRPYKQLETKIPIKKNKKTVKLFWKEVRDDPISQMKLKTGFIWDELSPLTIDTQKLEHLFESRAKDLITKKQQEMNKNKEIIVLDPKRSNAINIGMTKLPPPRSIKTAILKMDATIMNREGIEKLLTMLPTEEERTKIQEAQVASPDLPLGSAEQFLLTLASISELPARLKLWAFKLDFENSEKEIAEPLMDLKQGFEVLRLNKTFKGILSTLLCIGNFLNGNEVKGFQIEYLAKVPEVKDTVHKHSLLHHLCHIVMEKFPDATDLYSEIGAITRASKIDFDELALNIKKLETDCKASWDHLKVIAKHDGSTMMKVKMSDFLTDCAERIILLNIIHRRIMNRFHKFLLWLGIPLHQIPDTKPNEFCRVVSEFALEYRTTRERVLQQLEKKANHRERNKTRGKMITDVGKFKTKEDRADAELRQLLASDISDVESLQGTLPWRRTRRDVNRSFMNSASGNLTDGDDEILESLVKTATRGSLTRTAPRERKRTRHADRKSLKRSRTRENNPFGSRDSP